MCFSRKSGLVLLLVLYKISELKLLLSWELVKLIASILLFAWYQIDTI